MRFVFNAIKPVGEMKYDISGLSIVGISVKIEKIESPYRTGGFDDATSFYQGKSLC